MTYPQINYWTASQPTDTIGCIEACGGRKILGSVQVIVEPPDESFGPKGGCLWHCPITPMILKIYIR